VSKENGELVYYCFRASCHIAGRISTGRTIDDVKAIALGTVDFRGLTRNKDGIQDCKPAFEIPWYFQSIATNKDAHEYLRKNNCLGAYYDRACNIMFDPRLNRVVFTIRRRLDGVCVDAAGRLLKYAKGQPKWLRYASSDMPFIVGSRDNAVIVEDCASACAVYSSGYSGVSLLGTNLKKAFISELKHFKKCFVCLDLDASKKSIEMYKALSPYTDAHIRFIPQDLKYCSPEQIKNIIGE